MSFTTDTSGLAAFIAKVKLAATMVDPAMDEALDKIAEEGVLLLQEAAPYDPAENNGVIPGEEGHLRDSFDVVPADSGEAQIITHEPIKFSYVTQGTETPITPTIKQALWWPELEHPVAWVRGQDPNPFHEEVVDELKQVGSEIIIQTMTDMINGL